jgi:hypothetical protein
MKTIRTMLGAALFLLVSSVIAMAESPAEPTPATPTLEAATPSCDPAIISEAMDAYERARIKGIAHLSEIRMVKQPYGRYGGSFSGVNGIGTYGGAFYGPEL